jgi:hypothetical protein
MLANNSQSEKVVLASCKTLAASKPSKAALGQNASKMMLTSAFDT